MRCSLGVWTYAVVTLLMLPPAPLVSLQLAGGVSNEATDGDTDPCEQEGSQESTSEVAVPARSQRLIGSLANQSVDLHQATARLDNRARVRAGGVMSATGERRLLNGVGAPLRC